MTGMLIGFGFGLAGIVGGFVVTRVSRRLARHSDALTDRRAN